MPHVMHAVGAFFICPAPPQTVPLTTDFAVGLFQLFITSAWRVNHWEVRKRDTGMDFASGCPKALTFPLARPRPLLSGNDRT